MPAFSPDHRVTVGNRLLDMLSPERLKSLRPHFETVSIRANQVIQAPGAKVDFVFFPTSGMISIVATMADGAAVENGIAGKEGMFNVSVILGDDTPSQKAIVQLSGRAIRIRSTILRQAEQTDESLRNLLRCYTNVVLVNASQSAACNRLHELDRRCARWLLMAHDRAGTETFPITHHFLGMMLGVRRPVVTAAVQKFRANGLITYHHGMMTIRDRIGLEAAACECYRFVWNESERLLGPHTY